MLFDRMKYLGLVVALLLLTLACVLMSGPANHDPDLFDTGIFSFRRITLAPLLLIGTYSSLIFLIVKQPKNACQGKTKK